MPARNCPTPLKSPNKSITWAESPEWSPNRSKLPTDAPAMLRADLDNERETVANYRQRIRQAEAMGEFALSETLREIIVQEQEHEIDLSDALGIDVPPS